MPRGPTTLNSDFSKAKAASRTAHGNIQVVLQMSSPRHAPADSGVACPKDTSHNLLKGGLSGRSAGLKCSQCSTAASREVRLTGRCAKCDYDVCESCFLTLQGQRSTRRTAPAPDRSRPRTHFADTSDEEEQPERPSSSHRSKQKRTPPRQPHRDTAADCDGDVEDAEDEDPAEATEPEGEESSEDDDGRPQRQSGSGTGGRKRQHVSGRRMTHTTYHPPI